MAKSKRGPAARPRPATSGTVSQARPAGSRPSGTRQQTAAATRPAAARRPPRRSRRPLLYSAIAGVVVIAVVVALVIVKTTSSPSAATGASPAPADVVHAVSTVPASAFDAAGTGSGLNLVPPKAATGQPSLTQNGKPELFFVGAEYCPYCAAERWPLVVALSRFGAFHDLKVTTSSSTDVYPDTNTFSFYNSTYSSPYVSFDPVEINTNQPNGSGGYTTLESLTPEQSRLVAKYDAPPYTGSGSTSSQSAGTIPFMDWANKFVTSGASYSPQVLQGLSWGTIAGSLSVPSSNPAKYINAQANIFSAMICKLTNGQPSSVCSTSVIQKAEASLPTS